MNYEGLIIPDSIYMDVWDDRAQALFYQFSNESMFKIGVDAIWADATEPEVRAGKRVWRCIVVRGLGAVPL